jgi:hypothetical protein
MPMTLALRCVISAQRQPDQMARRCQIIAVPHAALHRTAIACLSLLVSRKLPGIA